MGKPFFVESTIENENLIGKLMSYLLNDYWFYLPYCYTFTFRRKNDNKQTEIKIRLKFRAISSKFFSLYFYNKHVWVTLFHLNSNGRHRIFFTKKKTDTHKSKKLWKEVGTKGSNKKKKRKTRNFCVRKYCKNTKETYINLALGYFFFQFAFVFCHFLFIKKMFD